MTAPAVVCFGPENLCAGRIAKVPTAFSSSRHKNLDSSSP